MAKNPDTTVSTANTKELSAAVKETFAEIAKLDAESRGVAGSRLFPSGIELIKFTVKVGSNIEFTIVIAGKDAPKVDSVPAHVERVIVAQGAA